MTDWIGEMYGERAVQAQFAAVVTREKPVNGVSRAMVGGVILAEIGTDTWQRWQGTMILIPRMIDKPRRPCGDQLNHMMINWLSRDLSEQAMKCGDSFWKPEWRPSANGEETR